MNGNEGGGIVFSRREALRMGATVLGGLTIGRVMPACLGDDLGEPFGPPLVVGRNEHGLRLYAFLRERYVVGYIPKRQGPLVIEISGIRGDFEFLRNGGEDPLNDQGLGTHRLLVNEGETWQPYHRPFADERESLRFEEMDPEDARIMAELDG